MGFIELIIALGVWYIIFAIATDEFNPLKWSRLFQALGTFVALGLILSIVG
jgi:hypothetical protein